MTLDLNSTYRWDFDGFRIEKASFLARNWPFESDFAQARDVITWNALMNSCRRGLQWARACDLLDRMRLETKPDVISTSFEAFKGILKAFSGHVPLVSSPFEAAEAFFSLHFEVSTPASLRSAR